MFTSKIDEFQHMPNREGLQPFFFSQNAAPGHHCENGQDFGPKTKSRITRFFFGKITPSKCYPCKQNKKTKIYAKHNTYFTMGMFNWQKKKNLAKK